MLLAQRLELGAEIVRIPRQLAALRLQIGDGAGVAHVRVTCGRIRLRPELGNLLRALLPRLAKLGGGTHTPVVLLQPQPR